ncbi:hypothetical protein SBADM41S_01975 [Streptomyces badius]
MAARPLVARQPNERLQTLIQEAACSNAGLARRVNMVGAERGLDLRYDKTSVARWLRGQQPRGRAPGIIAEALGRKLGRTVTIDEIGMANGKNLSSGVGLQYAPTVAGAVEQVCELWRGDVGRRDLLTGSAVAASALVEPSRDWLISGPDAQVERTAGARVGMSDVEAVRAMTTALTDLDHRFGSGHVRPVLVHYLNSVVSGLLSGAYREQVGRELFAAVARLTELGGYMAVDTGQPGLAQRYYIQALRLAQAAGDRAYGGYVLAASMSHLAAQLGNPREIAPTRPRRTGRGPGPGHPTRPGHVLRGGGAGARAPRGRPDLPRGGGAGRRRSGARRSRHRRRPGLDPALRHRLPRGRTGPLPPGSGSWAGRPGGPRRRWPRCRRPGPGAGASRWCCWPRPRCSSGRWSGPATRGPGRWSCCRRCAPAGAPSISTTSSSGPRLSGRSPRYGSSAERLELQAARQEAAQVVVRGGPGRFRGGPGTRRSGTAP